MTSVVDAGIQKKIVSFGTATLVTLNKESEVLLK